MVWTKKELISSTTLIFKRKIFLLKNSQLDLKNILMCLKIFMLCSKSFKQMWLIAQICNLHASQTFLVIQMIANVCSIFQFVAHLLIVLLTNSSPKNKRINILFIFIKSKTDSSSTFHDFIIQDFLYIIFPKSWKKKLWFLSVCLFGL